MPIYDNFDKANDTIGGKYAQYVSGKENKSLLSSFLSY
jgi:hypothetical protein